MSTPSALQREVLRLEHPVPGEVPKQYLLIICCVTQTETAAGGEEPTYYCEWATQVERAKIEAKIADPSSEASRDSIVDAYALSLDEVGALEEARDNGTLDTILGFAVGAYIRALNCQNDEHNHTCGGNCRKRKRSSIDAFGIGGPAGSHLVKETHR